MGPVFWVTLKGVFRDRVFHGIMMSVIIFLFIPSLSTLSMRQVTELSMTLSLSLISFILLLLALFLGSTSLWRDLERRYAYSVLGLPVSRRSYLFGRFAGISAFLMLTALVLGIASCLVVWSASMIYPPFRPVVWSTLVLAILYDALKYVLLVAIAFLLSSVSTSFFLPIFGTISLFFVGSATQQVYEFIHSPSAKGLSPLVKQAANLFYYLLPNFSAFDLTVNAVYSIPLSRQGLFLTAAYFAVYVGITLIAATVLFSRRELQ